MYWVKNFKADFLQPPVKAADLGLSAKDIPGALPEHDGLCPSCGNALAESDAECSYCVWDKPA